MFRNLLFKQILGREFLCSPVIRTPCFQCRGPGSVPDWGTKISQASRCSQTKTKICVCVSVVCVNQLLTVRLPGNSRILVVKCGGSDKLYSCFGYMAESDP